MNGPNNDLHDDELYPDVPECAVDDQMTPLDQLIRYQFAIRKICPLLDTYESNVLMQIVDRTTGWRRHAAWFGVDTLHSGDRLYGGLERQLHRSRLMKALASLERRGVIRRIYQRHYKTKIFRVNYEVDLERLQSTAPPMRKSRSVSGGDLMVSIGDQPVQEVHPLVSNEDIPVSNGDPIEGYLQNSIRIRNSDRRQQLAPSAPIAARSSSSDEMSGSSSSEPADPVHPEINPRRRTRGPAA